MLVFIVGYMGSGKSTLAKGVANKLLMDYIDTDKLIEKQEGLTITEIFEQKGEDYFRSLEHGTIRGLTSNRNLVVATGGGTPCFNNNMELMNKKGITVYLKIKPGILASRLEDAKHKRPILANKTSIELRAFIEAALAEREEYYESAAYTIEGDNIKSEDIVNLLR